MFLKTPAAMVEYGKHKNRYSLTSLNSGFFNLALLSQLEKQIPIFESSFPAASD
jgi:hypothetical protein